jgi:hypothetical protein
MAFDDVGATLGQFGGYAPSKRAVLGIVDELGPHANHVLQVMVATIGLLGSGWRAGAEDCGCELPTANRAGKRLLWVATALVVVVLAFPYLTPYPLYLL